MGYRGSGCRMPDSLEPPTGIGRWFARAPIWLYRHHLGWLLGHRFLLLNHIGRKTGLARAAVVEIVRHDASTGAYVICSGWGEHSQWFQNLMADSDTTIQVGSRTMAVRAVRLSPVVAADEMVDYSRRHPKAARRIAEFVGNDIVGADFDGSEAGYRAVGEELPFLRLEPR